MRIPDQNKTSQKGNWGEKMQHSSWIPKLPHLHHLDDDFFKNTKFVSFLFGLRYKTGELMI